MVVSLYNEVSALKTQIKNLKQKTSQPTIEVCTRNLLKGDKDAEAAIHLTKLLRQIKNYQSHCTKTASVSVPKIE